VAARLSGIFVPVDPGDPAWQINPQLLDPSQGVSAGHRTAAAAALVSSASVPDLRLAVPAADLTARVDAAPRPDALRWADSDALVRALASLKTSPELARGGVSWDTTLDLVVDEARAQVAAARGQADVLLVGLLICALLVLWQVADLLVRRRAQSVVQTRERGGTLLEIGSELFVEAAGCALAGAAIGLLCTRLVVGDIGWGWWVPVPFLAAAAAAVTGAALASSSTDPRRVPANRKARRMAARGRTLRRMLFVAAVVGAAALSFVALRERGVIGPGEGGGGATAASAPTWWAIAGAVLVIGILPVLAGLLLDATRRTTGPVAFFVAARVRMSGTRALPLLVVTVTVAQLTFALALTSTEQRGQAAGALLGVGGDARATLPAPGSTATALRDRVAAAPGVRAVVAARVEDEVRATSRTSADTVRLVAVDASAFEHLLALSALPDSPGLDRLSSARDDAVPALLLGGPPGLRDGLTVSDAAGRAIPLSVVGTAPRVQDAVDPVVVVDAATFARAGGASAPNTVWAVGPGAAAAVQAAAGRGAAVVVYADALAARRHAPLAAGLVRLAVASSALLLLFAVLGVVIGAAREADPRAESLGRLRSLGLRDRQLWGLVAGELMAPVLVGTVAGLVLGLTAALTMFDRLALERITDTAGPPGISVPAWVLLVGLALVVTVLALAQAEWTRLRRVGLGQLLRGGPPR
jgi:putative ABC transport system permease protein